MVEKFLSEDEKKLADFGDYHLTEDRVIKLVGDNKNREYKDIQLEHIASFYHSKNFNEALASALTSLAGLTAVIYAYLSISREYIIDSDTSTSIRLPDSKNTVEFWKEINQAKNH